MQWQTNKSCRKERPELKENLEEEEKVIHDSPAKSLLSPNAEDLVLVSQVLAVLEVECLDLANPIVAKEVLRAAIRSKIVEITTVLGDLE